MRLLSRDHNACLMIRFGSKSPWDLPNRCFVGIHMEMFCIHFPKNISVTFKIVPSRFVHCWESLKQATDFSHQCRIARHSHMKKTIHLKHANHQVNLFLVEKLLSHQQLHWDSKWCNLVSRSVQEHQTTYYPQYRQEFIFC